MRIEIMAVGYNAGCHERQLSSSANMNYSRSTLTTKNQISRKTLRVLSPSTLGREKTKMALVRATVSPSNKARASYR